MADSNTESVQVEGHLRDTDSRLELTFEQALRHVREEPFSFALDVEVTAHILEVFGVSASGLQQCQARFAELPEKLGLPIAPCTFSWGPGDLAYRCLSCQEHDNAAFCTGCFKAGDHEGHDYILYSSHGGGCCDCGDVTSVKKQGCCPSHRPRDAPQTATKDWQTVLTVEQRQKCAIILKALLRRAHEELALSCCLHISKILHPQPDVLERLLLALSKYCSMSVLNAVAVEVLVEEEREEWTYDRGWGSHGHSERLKAAEAFREAGGGVLTDDPMANLQAAKTVTKGETTISAMLQWLDHLDDSKRGSPTHLVADVLTILLRDDRFKLALGRQMAKMYIAGHVVPMGHNLHRVMDRISVQIFLNPQTSLHILKETSLLSIVADSLHTILDGTRPTGHGPVVSGHRNFHSSSACQRIVGDVTLMLQHDSVAEYAVDDGLLTDFLTCLQMFAGADAQQCRTSEHVEYENTDWQLTATIENAIFGSTIQTTIKSLLDSSGGDAAKLQYKRLESLLTNGAFEAYFGKEVGFWVDPGAATTWSDGLFRRTLTNPVSGRIPMSHALGTILRAVRWLQRAMSIDKGEQDVEDSLPSLESENGKLCASLGAACQEVLKVQCWMSQISAGWWVRNGRMPRSFTRAYNTRGWSKQAQEPDIIVLQHFLASSCLPSGRLLRVVIAPFLMKPDAVFDNAFEPDILNLSCFLIGLRLLVTTLRDRSLCDVDEHDSRISLAVQVLAEGPRSFSGLSKELDEKKLEILNKVVEAVAVVSRAANEIDPPMYHLREDWWHCFDPYHPCYTLSKAQIALRNAAKAKWPPAMQFKNLPPLPLGLPHLYRVLECKETIEFVARAVRIAEARAKNQAIAPPALTLLVMTIQHWESLGTDNPQKERVAGLLRLTLTGEGSPEGRPSPLLGVIENLAGNEEVEWEARKCAVAAARICRDFLNGHLVDTSFIKGASEHSEAPSTKALRADDERKRRARERQAQLMAAMRSQQAVFDQAQKGISDTSPAKKGTKRQAVDEEEECALCCENDDSKGSLGLVANVHLCNVPEISFGIPHELGCCWDPWTQKCSENDHTSTVFERARGLHVHACGHKLHLECLRKHIASMYQAGSEGRVHAGVSIVAPAHGEFQCPNCRRVSNAILPIFHSPKEAAVKPTRTAKRRASTDRRGTEDTALSSITSTLGGQEPLLQQLCQRAVNALSPAATGSSTSEPEYSCEPSSEDLDNEVPLREHYGTTISFTAVCRNVIGRAMQTECLVNFKPLGFLDVLRGDVNWPQPTIDGLVSSEDLEWQPWEVHTVACSPLIWATLGHNLCCWQLRSLMAKSDESDACLRAASAAHWRAMEAVASMAWLAEPPEAIRAEAAEQAICAVLWITGGEGNEVVGGQKPTVDICKGILQPDDYEPELSHDPNSLEHGYVELIPCSWRTPSPPAEDAPSDLSALFPTKEASDGLQDIHKDGDTRVRAGVGLQWSMLVLDPFLLLLQLVSAGPRHTSLECRSALLKDLVALVYTMVCVKASLRFSLWRLHIKDMLEDFLAQKENDSALQSLYTQALEALHTSGDGVLDGDHRGGAGGSEAVGDGERDECSPRQEPESMFACCSCPEEGGRVRRRYSMLQDHSWLPANAEEACAAQAVLGAEASGASSHLQQGSWLCHFVSGEVLSFLSKAELLFELLMLKEQPSGKVWGRRSGLKARALQVDEIRRICLRLDLPDLPCAISALDSHPKCVEVLRTWGGDQILQCWRQGWALLKKKYVTGILASQHHSSIEARMALIVLSLHGQAPPRLFPLPRKFQDLCLAVEHVDCRECQRRPGEPALCLLCGDVICFRDVACNVVRYGEEGGHLHTNVFPGPCCQHAASCGGGACLFLMIKSAQVLVLSQTRACMLPSLYLDDHGEDDEDFRRGRPMYLHAARWERLQQLWAYAALDFDTAIVSESFGGASLQGAELY